MQIFVESDKMSDGLGDGSDKSHDESDIVRCPAAISSPECSVVCVLVMTFKFAPSAHYVKIST